MYIDPIFNIAKNSVLCFSGVISFTTILINSYLLLLQLFLVVLIVTDYNYHRNPKLLRACYLNIVCTDCKKLKVMNYGAWLKNTKYMPNFIKIRLSEAVIDFETCRGKYNSVETNYQRDGQAQLTVN